MKGCAIGRGESGQLHLDHAAQGEEEGQAGGSGGGDVQRRHVDGDARHAEKLATSPPLQLTIDAAGLGVSGSDIVAVLSK